MQLVRFLNSVRFDASDILGGIKNTGYLIGSSSSTIFLGFNGLGVI